MLTIPPPLSDHLPSKANSYFRLHVYSRLYLGKPETVAKAIMLTAFFLLFWFLLLPRSNTYIPATFLSWVLVPSCYSGLYLCVHGHTCLPAPPDNSLSLFSQIYLHICLWLSASDFVPFLPRFMTPFNFSAVNYLHSYGLHGILLAANLFYIPSKPTTSMDCTALVLPKQKWDKS